MPIIFSSQSRANYTMTLRTKTLLIVGTALVGLLVMLLLVSYKILLTGFADLEYQSTEKSVNRLVNVLTDEIYSLYVEAKDYSTWDDTYKYMSTQNPEFITSNFSVGTFSNLHLNLVILIDRTEHIVAGITYNSTAYKTEPLPLSYYDYFEHNRLFTYHNENQGQVVGFMLLSGQLLLVASRPILPSQGEGTSQGTLIMGRFFSAEERQRLNRLTDLSLTVQLLNHNQTLPDEFAKARTLLLNKRMVVQTLNENSIAGYVLIKDVYQQPVALLRIELPREIYQEGLASLRYLSAVVLIVALAFAGLILWLFERLVLARLAVLSNEVRHIRTSDDFLTVTVKGQDELAHLATTINNMLSALQASHTRLRQSEAETLRLLEENRFLIYHSMEIQEDERRYLARELHDEFGQCITAIQADAEAIAELAQESSTTDNVTAKIKISADAILTVSAHIYDVVHTLMRQLRPSGLDELGLVEILQEMVRTWQARHPETRCTLTTQGKLDQLGETVNITLYRVMQECLTNVAKYANASQVTITLEANSVTQQLILKVQDNGQGMSLTKPRRGLGLIGIRERTQALEGHLQLESSEGQGMKITLTIPIAEEYQQKRRKRQ